MMSASRDAACSPRRLPSVVGGLVDRPPLEQDRWLLFFKERRMMFGLLTLNDKLWGRAEERCIEVYVYGLWGCVLLSQKLLKSETVIYLKNKTYRCYHSLKVF